MLAKLQERRENEEGFTLIELMVVVLIIAILVAIAVPTFMGARERAQDRGAQSGARNALTVGRIIFTDNGNFGAPANIVASLGAADNGMTFQAGASTTSTQISVDTVDLADADTNGDVIEYRVMSQSGTCFILRDGIGNGGSGAVQYHAINDATAAQCTADADEAIAAFSGW